MSPRPLHEQFEMIATAPETGTGLDPATVLRTIAALYAAELNIRATLPRVPPSIRAHRRSGHGF